jgi:hypothetical protein
MLNFAGNHSSSTILSTYAKPAQEWRDGFRAAAGIYLAMLYVPTARR